jgi:hypothetical protein
MDYMVGCLNIHTKANCKRGKDDYPKPLGILECFELSATVSTQFPDKGPV